MTAKVDRVRYIPDADGVEYLIPRAVADALKFGTDSENMLILMAAAAEGASRLRRRQAGEDVDGDLDRARAERERGNLEWGNP